MARGLPNLLTSSVPRTVAPADVTIGHIQLRDVVICPHERGTVCYPHLKHIVEHNLTVPSAPPRPLVELPFTPNSLSSLVLNDTNQTLLAAGGQEAELHLSLYSSPSPYQLRNDDFLHRARSRSLGFGSKLWGKEKSLKSASINNSVMLTSLNLTKSHESSVEPRVIVSNNDKSVKFFDVAIRSSDFDPSCERLIQAGQLRLEVPVNHSSISPDARTLLSVGDSPDVYLHRITGGSRLSFTPMAKLSLAPYITPAPFYNYNPYMYQTTNVPASFSTAFSANGSKFAVASQEGVVVIWDVRSTKPLKVIQTDKTRGSGTGSARAGPGGISAWSFENQWDWTRGSANAPGWGVRSIKFSPNGVGQEVLTFTEHTSVLHVLDARTFETEEIVRVPNFDSVQLPRPTTARPRSLSPASRPSPSPPDTSSILPPPPRLLVFSGAVEDTFRIPLTEPSTRRRRGVRRIRNRDGSSAPGGTDQEELDSIVVVPPLGNRELDDRVHTLLGQISELGRRNDGHVHRLDDDERIIGEDEMDIDELEADCLSSHTPSRASSPVPVGSATSTPALNAPAPSSRLPSPYDLLRSASRTSYISRRDTSGPYLSRRPSGQGLRRHRRSAQQESNTNPLEDIEQDLAGMCFDPTGEYIYVGAVKGISEWKIRGAEKSWWVDSAWA